MLLAIKDDKLIKACPHCGEDKEFDIEKKLNESLRIFFYHTKELKGLYMQEVQPQEFSLKK